jgi:hypothetical protein
MTMQLNKLACFPLESSSTEPYKCSSYSSMTLQTKEYLSMTNTLAYSSMTLQTKEYLQMTNTLAYVSMMLS